MKIVLSTQVQNRNRNFSIQVEDIFDNKNPQKIQDMLDTLDEFIPSGQNLPIHVQYSPENQFDSQSTSSIPDKGSQTYLKKPWKKNQGHALEKTFPATNRQIGYLRDILCQLNIPESKICQDYNVDCIEHFPGNVAQKLIGDLLKTLSQSKHNKGTRYEY